MILVHFLTEQNIIINYRPHKFIGNKPHEKGTTLQESSYSISSMDGYNLVSLAP